MFSNKHGSFKGCHNVIIGINVHICIHYFYTVLLSMLPLVTFDVMLLLICIVKYLNSQIINWKLSTKVQLFQPYPPPNQNINNNNIKKHSHVLKTWFRGFSFICFRNFVVFPFIQHLVTQQQTNKQKIIIKRSPQKINRLETQFLWFLVVFLHFVYNIDNKM